jgi:hypothetical protein
MTAGARDWQAQPGSDITHLDLSAYRCESEPRVATCRLVAPEGLRVGSIPALGQTLFYRDGRLERVSTAIDPADFDPTRRWLIAQFGPGDEHTERLRAGMGGSFDNLTVAWRLADRCLLLEQHFERVTQSGVSVMDCKALEALLRARERQRVRGLRDF